MRVSRLCSIIYIIPKIAVLVLYNLTLPSLSLLFLALFYRGLASGTTLAQFVIDL
jgi:hypothetical protein